MKARSEFIPYVSINSYIAARVLFKSLKAYHEGEFDSLSEALHNLEFKIWGKKIRFDEYGDRLDEDLVIVQSNNDEFVIYE